MTTEEKAKAYDEALEKQGEQKPAVTDFNAKDWYVSKVDGKIHDMTYNPADKVESKFKVGDWVVDNRTGVIHYIANIKGTVNGCYYVFGNDKGLLHIDNEEDYHIWTIQDAKDGDVLVDKCGNIGIYQGDKNALRWNSYCYCGLNKVFYDEGSHEFPCYPATKEQRDTLMKAMADAGYEWNDSTKELKKINSYCQENCKGYQETSKCFADGGCDAYHKAEQKPTTWSEEDKEMIECLMNCLDELEKEQGWLYIYINNKDVKLNKVRNWLKSLKEGVQPQPKQEWNGEDDAYKELAICAVANFYDDENPLQKCIVNWLKSLKDKIKEK